MPRSVRGRPSGPKAAPHRLRRRPAAGPDPGDHWGPAGGSPPRARPKACPGKRTASPASLTRAYGLPGSAIYRHRCNDPLSPPPQIGAELRAKIQLDLKHGEVAVQFVAGDLAAV